MPSKDIELGPTGQRVAANIAALRERLRLTKTDLSRRLEWLGRPLSLDVLTKIEKGTRRVDSDDLVAIAMALEVNPNVLLAPLNDLEANTHLTSGIRATGKVYWPWLYGQEPLLQWNSDDTFSVHGREEDSTLNLDKVIAFVNIAMPFRDENEEEIALLAANMVAARRRKGASDGKR